MNPTIQLLLSQILLLVARLHANPAYQVHSSTSGQVDQLEVLIYPAGATWRDRENTPTPIARAGVIFKAYDWEWYTAREKAKAEARPIQELEFLRAALHAYLPVEAVAELEAAA